MGRHKSNSLLPVAAISFAVGASIPLLILLIERRRWKEYRQNGNYEVQHDAILSFCRHCPPYP
jgi:hypothetical protein